MGKVLGRGVMVTRQVLVLEILGSSPSAPATQLKDKEVKETKRLITRQAFKVG